MKVTQDERDELRKAAEQWQGKTPHELLLRLLLRLLDDADAAQAAAQPSLFWLEPVEESARPLCACGVGAIFGVNDVRLCAACFAVKATSEHADYGRRMREAVAKVAMRQGKDLPGRLEGNGSSRCTCIGDHHKNCPMGGYYERK